MADSKYGKRPDGTEKGAGFLGELPTTDGRVATEVSIGVNIHGKEVDIPTLVPTLSEAEVQSVLNGDISDVVVDKAVAHAQSRMSRGKGPFKEDPSVRSGPFGSEWAPVPEVLDPEAGTAAGIVPDSKVPIADSDIAGYEARAASRLWDPTSYGDTILGTARNWDTTKLVERVIRPSFKGEEPINQYEYLEGVQIPLTDAQREFFLSVGKGVDSAAYAMGLIEQQNEAHKLFAANPKTAFLVGFLDPVWLVIPPSVGAGRAVASAAKGSKLLGRLSSGAIAAGTAASITAAREGPVTGDEIVMSALMNGIISAAVYTPKGPRAADPDFPKDGLKRSLDPNVEVLYHTDPKTGKKVPLPDELQPGFINTDQAKVVSAMEAALENNAKSRGIGEKAQWNMRKEMSGYGKNGSEVADILYDNNSNLGKHSLESHREAILGDYNAKQLEYYDMLRESMAEDGFGLMKQINPATAVQSNAHQARIEDFLYREMQKREQANRYGNTYQPPDARTARLMDKLDELTSHIANDLNRAGVVGAEKLKPTPGWLPRRWSAAKLETILSNAEAKGIPRATARSQLSKMIADGLERGSTMNPKLAGQVADAIIDRALRKGQFDGNFGSSTTAQIAELRDMLRSSGVRGKDADRVIEVMTGHVDEAGKADFLKRRVQLDYDVQANLGGDTFTIADLLDTRISNLTDQYTRSAATQSAFARMGLNKPSDIAALRKKLLDGIPDISERSKAAKLFDNTMDYFNGAPAGAQMNENFRLFQQFGRMISLPWGGLWQMTEYANMMAEYGLRRTLKYAMREIPGFKQLMTPNTAEAQSLVNILEGYSQQSMRLRPHIARFEDGFSMPDNSGWHLAAQQAGALVPYSNGMKYIHSHQSTVVANLVVDRLRQAAGGDVKAQQMLAKYGLNANDFKLIQADIRKNGLNVDLWSDGTWERTRPAFAKMMDEAVLKGRLGDRPSFAVFDPTGKMIFTYRDFVLTAHNKLFAGGLARNGTGAVGLMAMYQFPLAMMAVQAKSVLAGDGVLSPEEMAGRALGQMGGIGLLSEPVRWATGESNSVGAPALIPADRGVKLFQNGIKGEMEGAARTLSSMIPLAATNPFIRAIESNTRD